MPRRSYLLGHQSPLHKGMAHYLMSVNHCEVLEKETDSHPRLTQFHVMQFQTYAFFFFTKYIQ